MPQQTALQAQGAAAESILQLTWILFAGGALIFVAVMVLLALALFGSGRWRARLAGRGWVVGGGIVFPVLALSALLVHTFGATAGMDRLHREPAAARIQVAGEMWWWRVRYLDPGGALLAETANEIRIPLHRRVDLELVSNDVIHSFWVPNLHGKLDMLPGKVNRLRLHASQPGVYRGQCAEYCGAQHANMALEVVVQPQAEYDAWLAAQRQAAAPPTGAELARGREVFREQRCGVCHAVRGTEHAGTLGPDLTHVASRRTLAAATLANDPERLAQWLQHAQRHKPGVRMPSYPHLPPQDLQALVAWLASLR